MHIEALLIALLISFLWGLSVVIHKTVLNTVRPQTTMVISSIFYMMCTIAYAMYYRREIMHDRSKLNAKAVLYIAFTAIICGFLTNALYFKILQRYESHVISALIYSSPIFTLLMSYLLLKERITMPGFLGVIFIVMGVVMLAFNRSGDELFGVKQA